MSLFDSFHGNCPHCNERNVAQTKLGENKLLHIREGERYKCNATDKENYLLLTKTKCYECKRPLVAKIQEGKFQGFTTVKESEIDLKEEAFGDVE